MFPRAAAKNSCCNHSSLLLGWHTFELDACTVYRKKESDAVLVGVCAIQADTWRVQDPLDMRSSSKFKIASSGRLQLITAVASKPHRWEKRNSVFCHLRTARKNDAVFFRENPVLSHFTTLARLRRLMDSCAAFGA
jgi:hypothetical protein